MWDPEQYERFRAERSRPFFDLLERIPDRSYRAISDLGCGTGDLTAALSEHWPQARVLGVDNSTEMLTKAAKHRISDRLEFTPGDISQWRPGSPQDLIVSNATFQWIPDAAALLRHVAACLAPKGVLAVQMPDNSASPSQEILRELERSGPWAERLKGRPRQDAVLPLARYLELLWAEGFDVDAWESVYLHVLPGDDAVLEWMKGTTLRPVLQALGDTDRDPFVARYREQLAAAYPKGPSGTLFPFRRLFFVGKLR
ncbi:MAG TPA: methyltransferase domain-containing protein [Planctomycetota bacterium]|jgi:trans-aconitate 2-methyltransferase|nr:methyltransferase domain-containing protein [Planctomycetota bacterium]